MNPDYDASLAPAKKPTKRPPSAAPADGVGTALEAILAGLGLGASKSCGCAKWRGRMNAWGPVGCRTHRGEIEAHLRAEAARVGWVGKLKAGAAAVAQGLILNPLDPAPGLLDEAIRRVEDRVAGSMLTIPPPPPLSLTPRHPLAVVTVVVGEEGRRLFAASGPHMRRYADRVGADLVVLDDYAGPPGWPMGAKFGIARVLGHYERIAYVDADVLLRPAAVNLFGLCDPHEFGAANELPFHRDQTEHGIESLYREYRRRMGYDDSAPPRHYFNAGVMVVPRSHRAVIEAPPELWVPAEGSGRHCAEQNLVNARLSASGLPFRAIDRRGNWQSWTPGFNHAPADAVLHYSGSPRATRAAMIRKAAAAAPWPHQPFDPPAFLTPADPVAATDLRHVRWIRETLRSGRFRRTLEVGCLHGYASSAFLDAAREGEVDVVHLCDPVVTDELRRAVAHYGVPAVVHREPSAELFARGTPFDLVFLDGDHAEATVRAEAAALVAGGARAVFCHDTSAREYPGCEGPQHLQPMFVAAGYRCIEDHVVRPGERTERGMLFAARSEADFAAGLAAYRATCST